MKRMLKFGLLLLWSLWFSHYSKASKPKAISAVSFQAAPFERDSIPSTGAAIFIATKQPVRKSKSLVNDNFLDFMEIDDLVLDSIK